MGVADPNLELLTEFLIKAKKATYASGQKGEKLSDGSERFRFAEGDLEYVDEFSGTKHFGGSEVILHRGKRVWFMGYYGGLHLVDDPKEDIYAFLRKALLQIGTPPENPFAPILPFRGPERFQEGDFTYENEMHGSIKRFQGSEIIYRNGGRVYMLEYSGGIIE
jgi:hypothetical protein